MRFSRPMVSEIIDFIMACGVDLYNFMKSHFITIAIFLLLAVFPRLIRLFKWSVGFK